MPDTKKVILRSLDKEENPEQFVRQFISEHQNTIHVLGGLRGCKAVEIVKKYIFRLQNPKVVVVSERPNLYGNWVKTKILLPLLYRYFAMKYQRKIGAYFAMGTLGIEAFVRFGWKRDLFYPFMYQTRVETIGFSSLKSHEKIKFLFVGRFDTQAKGIDILIESFNRLEQGHWTLDLVGIGGNFEEKTVTWCKTHPDVAYLGTWNSKTVIDNMTTYDVCIIPSRYDGWGMVTNEALMAGVGCIVTDNTGSKDLVEASGAGMVIPANDVQSLVGGLRNVLDHPETIDLWKNKAREYAGILNSDCVNQFFLDVIKHTFIEKQAQRPVCLWLVQLR
jgi:glycosyltransferase involved in cell wall biosynthesis